MPPRDLWVYLQALRRHFGGLVGGTFVAFVLILWDDVLHLGNIPEGVWMIVAVLGVFISGFNAWREEHGKVVTPREAVDPEMEVRRPEFERQIAKLSPEQEAMLHYMARVGDANAMQLRDNFFPQQGKTGGAHDAHVLLLGIADTGLLEPKERGTAFPRYAIKPVWSRLLIEWAAPPTAVDKRIADKARALRRTLAASFENWPNGVNKLDELTTWAARLLGGFPVTEKALKEIVDLRHDASRRVERAVGTAQDEYYAAADVITTLFKDRGLSIDDNNRQAVETDLRQAVAHVKQCIAAL